MERHSTWWNARAAGTSEEDKVFLFLRAVNVYKPSKLSLVDVFKQLKEPTSGSLHDIPLQSGPDWRWSSQSGE
jgi:hypothetical protein